jgi:3-methylcrotonyl-CoA carboxylase alpha subunit
MIEATVNRVERHSPGNPMGRTINTLLIANRGEIACRIMRTAKTLGIRTLAVFADGDHQHPFVQMADEAFPLKGQSARETYLDQDKLIQIATRHGADAIHPGYGFLSENAAFAKRCEQAGIVFVGPTAEAIQAMGSKAEAKHRMAAAGVPLIPGYHGENQQPEYLLIEAQRIGFPVLLKASAGGGGKGMRMVEDANNFIEALEAARRECQSAFGDARMIIEKYFQSPRHVEVQIFFDQQGQGVYLFDRDCSVQRRHQKVIEEAPAPGLSDSTRRAMGAAALECGRSIGYRGAGTIEFLLDSEQHFYFMEMNTRLQVEHPVTEMISHVDLVEWQLRVAAGEPLPLQQHELHIDGHAVEARLYAESPEQGFLPSTGRLSRLRFPQPNGQGLRIDNGVAEGNEISVHFDPMIAKVIFHGKDRRQAINGLSTALAASRIAGVHSNREYLLGILSHPAFQAADLSTRFIDQWQAELLRPRALDTVHQIAAALLLNQLETRREIRNPSTSDPWSPWQTQDNWRSLHEETMSCTFWYQEKEFVAELSIAANRATVCLNSHMDRHVESFPVTFAMTDDSLMLWHADQRYNLDYLCTDIRLMLWDGARCFDIERPTDAAMASHHSQEAGSLQAPMGGTIVRVMCQPGDTISKGQTLVVMEAMKMEYAVKAPRDGVVTRLLCQEKDTVQAGRQLVELNELNDGKDDQAGKEGKEGRQ